MSLERQDKRKGCLWYGLGFMAINLLFFSTIFPIIPMGCSMWKADRAMRVADARIRKDANPDEIRAWASGLLKRPDAKRSDPGLAEHMPEPLSRLGFERTVYIERDLHLSGSGNVVVVWRFGAGYGLKMTVLIAEGINTNAPLPIAVPSYEWKPDIWLQFLVK